MIRVLNCSPHEELRELRHTVLSTAPECEVTSATPNAGMGLLAREKFDVLVICYQMQNEEGDALCIEFRHINPAGRTIAIVGVPCARECEADVVVDAHRPAALLAAIASYPAARAEFQYERRLRFHDDPKWKGWSCDRCCWNRPASAATSEADSIMMRPEFDKHSCEAFRRGHPSPSVAGELTPP